MSNQPLIQALRQARRAEKEQSIFYRALAARAESDNNAQLSEDLNGLHADEQHHLSRLSVRLVELGQPLDDLEGLILGVQEYPNWQPAARARERAEVDRYEKLLQESLDADTEALIREILDAERKHAESLAGKYMNA